jgi:hypothetical protein
MEVVTASTGILNSKLNCEILEFQFGEGMYYYSNDDVKISLFKGIRHINFIYNDVIDVRYFIEIADTTSEHVKNVLQLIADRELLAQQLLESFSDLSNMVIYHICKYWIITRSFVRNKHFNMALIKSGKDRYIAAYRDNGMKKLLKYKLRHNNIEDMIRKILSNIKTLYYIRE